MAAALAAAARHSDTCRIDMNCAFRRFRVRQLRVAVFVTGFSFLLVKCMLCGLLLVKAYGCILQQSSLLRVKSTTPTLFAVGGPCLNF